jgi:choline kinase
MPTAIILCAGSARRFFPTGKSRPKCLLPITSDETLLDRLLRQLRATGRRIVLGTGNGHDAVVDAIAGLDGVDTVFNPDYATTNSIATLWLCRAHVGDDTLVVNGDLLVDDGVFDRFEDAPVPQLLVKRLPAFDADVYRVVFDERRRVLRMGKDLTDPPALRAAAFLGASRVGDAAAFLAGIETLLTAGDDQTWPTTAYRRMVAAGREVRALDIGDALFFDVDTPEEYEDARRQLVSC